MKKQLLTLFLALIVTSLALADTRIGVSITQAGMRPGKDILVGGSDGGPAGLDAIKKDQLVVTAYQDSKGQAAGSIDLALKMIRKQPYTAELTIPYQQITKANYQDFLTP